MAQNSDKRKQSLHFPEEMLLEIQEQATRQDRSLSWIVQQAHQARAASRFGWVGCGPGRRRYGAQPTHARARLRRGARRRARGHERAGEGHHVRVRLPRDARPDQAA